MQYVRRRRQGWLLLLILCVALYIRIVSVDFGLPALNDPDELMFELGALRMLRGLTLDPGWFGHPATTTMYVLALINAGVFGFALLTGQIASGRQFGELVYNDPGWMILPGRVAMVLFALGTIWLTCRLASRFFGPKAGLVAAILLALNPVHITWSQIIRSDMMACFFMLLCLQSCAAIAETARRRDYRLAATWLGLAIATKWPFALAGLAIAMATLVAVRAGILLPRRALVRLADAYGMAVVVLFLVSPYLLIDYPTVLSNLQGEAQAYHLGATGGGFAYNLLWYLGGPIDSGFGAAGLALLAFGAFRLSRRPRAAAILVPLTIAFLLLFCVQRLIWERWALPLMPLGAILAGWGFVQLTVLINRSGRFGAARWAPAAILLATLVPLGARAWSDGHARMNDTRQLASAWARAYIPPGSNVLVEHYAFDIVGEPWHILFPIGDAGCVDTAALLHGRTSYAVIERARAGRSNVDYGTMAAARRRDCHADFAILTQFDRYRAERGRFPAEYAAYRGLLAKGSIVATFAPVTRQVGGPVVRIVDLRAGGNRP